MNQRITQKDIARLAGVSQTVVSFVLNERDENLAR
ncbi:MAG: Bacterial regulatory protein lacI family, partial [Subtercola sp.]|nr:Bacterial regulatory protein lacI family [Subtercola sp.]